MKAWWRRSGTAEVVSEEEPPGCSTGVLACVLWYSTGARKGSLGKGKGEDGRSSWKNPRSEEIGSREAVKGKGVEGKR